MHERSRCLIKKRGQTNETHNFIFEKYDITFQVSQRIGFCDSTIRITQVYAVIITHIIRLGIMEIFLISGTLISLS